MGKWLEGARDWSISRQRYWGTPIPIVYCPKCGTVPVPEEDLPVLLPDDIEDFRPTGQPPLASSKKFNSNVKCPKCGADATREHDTMDGFVDNSWYYYRYLDPRNEKEFCAKDLIKEWMPVDTYVGGAEHAVGHLIYSRFFTKVLRDNGYLPVDRSLGGGGKFDEPFLKLINQGLILGIDGQKMSKSLGNVVNPDEVIEEYGADSFRMYEMFMGPFDQTIAWDIKTIEGVNRFLLKVKTLVLENKNRRKEKLDIKKLEQLTHQAIKKVGQDIENMKFNTAVAALMEYNNELINFNVQIPEQNIKILLLLLSPFAPHWSEELWHQLQPQLSEEQSIFQQSWPKFNEKLIQKKEIELIVQINGKIRDKILTSIDISQKQAEKMVLQREKIQKFIKDKKIKKIIFVPKKLINFVI